MLTKMAALKLGAFIRKKIHSGKKLWESVLCWRVREENISLPTLRLPGGTATLLVTHS